jgi:CheY-like chemotaxis protein
MIGAVREGSSQQKPMGNSCCPEHCPNILVVDDEPFIVQYVRHVLEFSNYGVVTATNAEQPWAIFEQHRVRISLLLTGIVMPGLMDGLDLAAKIRKVEPAFPILFLSGAIPDGDPRAAGTMLSAAKTVLSERITRFPRAPCPAASTWI